MFPSVVGLIALSSAVFAAMKFIFWTNAVIFLPPMGRRLPRTYWAFTPIEVALSAVASVTFSAAIIFRIDGWLLSGPFVISALAWLAYMSRRVWLMSVPKR